LPRYKPSSCALQIKELVHKENKTGTRIKHGWFLVKLPIKEYDIFIARLSIRIQNTHGITFDMFRLQMSQISCCYEQDYTRLTEKENNCFYASANGH
jgi:hypothetical protein